MNFYKKNMKSTGRMSQRQVMRTSKDVKRLDGAFGFVNMCMQVYVYSLHVCGCTLDFRSVF